MNLNDLESRLQTLIEVRLVSMLPGRKMEDLVIQKLAGAMQSNLIMREDGVQIAPDVYTLIVHPDSAAGWQEPHLLDTIIEALNAAGQEAGLKFTSLPSITIATDANLSLNDVNLIASHRAETTMEDTKGMSTDAEGGAEDGGTLPENAFLIIEGVKVYPLKESVINIGRRLGNHLVIDDPRVSRNHAQLRIINGRYVLFDLNSTGGTFVNGQRTSQSVLYPGDVISLAGVALIFGQDNPPPRPDLKDTSPFQSSPIDRPTAIIKTTPFKKPKK